MKRWKVLVQTSIDDRAKWVEKLFQKIMAKIFLRNVTKAR